MQDIKSIEKELRNNPQLLELMKIAITSDKDVILKAIELLAYNAPDGGLVLTV